jgi:hypothetical protein
MIDICDWFLLNKTKRKRDLCFYIETGETEQIASQSLEQLFLGCVAALERIGQRLTETPEIICTFQTQHLLWNIIYIYIYIYI